MRFRGILTVVVLPVVTLTLLIPADLLAQDHVVSTADLRNELRAATMDRQGNMAKLESFLSSEGARKALASTKMDPARVRQAIPLLSDQELARLAAQADHTQADFAAGLTNAQVTYIIIGLIAIAVIAIVAK